MFTIKLFTQDLTLLYSELNCYYDHPLDQPKMVYNSGPDLSSDLTRDVTLSK